MTDRVDIKAIYELFPYLKKLKMKDVLNMLEAFDELVENGFVEPFMDNGKYSYRLTERGIRCAVKSDEELDKLDIKNFFY